MPLTDYFRVNYGEPHEGRGREMLATHPELKSLAGHQPSSAAWTLLMVVVQCALAVWLQHTPWYLWLPVAYVVGATIDHALWAMIHECSHNLIFVSRTANRVVGIVANIPLVFPAAMSFCKYHLIHHRHMGEMELDAGVPGPTEARVIGQSGVMKSLWLAGQVFVQGLVRPMRMKAIPFMDGWTAANAVFQVGSLVVLAVAAGPGSLKYLLASSVFAIGLHPLGARWIQEHFALKPDQETYSYYGPLNRVCFNLGYHNEHHDMMTVPWSRLPKIRAMAPEFYQGLHSYESWTGLMLEFIRNRDITLFHYIVRPWRRIGQARRPGAAASISPSAS